MFDFAVSPGGAEYYMAVEPRATWRCPHCRTEWNDWGEHADDEERPWEAESDYGELSADPDLGWCCPCCAVRRASFSTMVSFVEDCGLVKEAVNDALTEDGVGAIEKGFHTELWMLYKMGFNARFASNLRDYVEQCHPGDFVDWVQVSA